MLSSERLYTGDNKGAALLQTGLRRSRATEELK